MAGFAAAIGGAGQEAQQYGQQIRSILESRRDHVASMLSQILPTLGTEDRNQMITHIAGISGGESLGKHLLGVTKVLQSHQKDQQAAGQAANNFAQMIGPQPQQPEPTPSATKVGETPGTSTTIPQGGAAQPTTSPVQSSGPIQTGIPPVQAPASSVSASAMPLPPGLASALQTPPQPTFTPSATASPVAEDPMNKVRAMRDAVTAKWLPLIQGASQIDKPHLTMLYQQEVANLAPFEQQAMREANLTKLQGTDEYKNANPMFKLGPVEEAYGFQPSGLGGAARLMSVTPRFADATNMTPEQKAQMFIPPNATGKYTVETDGLGNPTGRTWQGWAGTTNTTSATGVQGVQDKNTALANEGALTAVGGGPSMTRAAVSANVTPRSVTDSTGHIQFLAAPDINKGNFINPAFAPVSTSSTLNVPGQLPQTTTTVRKKGQTNGAAPVTITPGSGGGVSPISTTPTSPSSDLERRKYDDWVGGKGTPTGKDLTAVQAYAASHNLPSPISLSSAGQRDLSHIDEVLQQIHDIKSKMEASGLDKKDDLDYYPEYFRYAHLGKYTPNQGIWTDISFEGPRSAAAALQGINSRALPIINRALAHVPRPEANATNNLPDTTKAMYQKLTEMEDILTHGRKRIIEDERKSGVIPPDSSSPPNRGTVTPPGEDLSKVPTDELMRRLLAPKR